jgi:hypothetical protein
MNNNPYRNNTTYNKNYTIDNDGELFLIEFLYGLNLITFSYIKNNKFQSKTHKNILAIFETLIASNKKCKILLDALPTDVRHIQEFINKHELDFVVEMPVGDIKKARVHRLTLIEFYINERKLLPM